MLQPATLYMHVEHITSELHQIHVHGLWVTNLATVYIHTAYIWVFGLFFFGVTVPAKILLI